MKKFSFIVCLLSVTFLYAQDPQLDAAKAKIDAKDFEGAKADLKKLIDASPKNKHAFNLRGIARTGLSDFYGAIGDNDTETRYTVTGKNEGTGLLDNDNNLAKLVVIRDIEPADDATISIKMSPGPNNSQWARFFGVNAMLILPEGMDVPFPRNNFELQHPVYVDFGTLRASAPFNFFDSPWGAPVFDLKDAQGSNTGFSMTVTDRFNDQNHSGAPTNTLGLPAEVSRDAFWGDRGNPTSGFTLYNLNTDATYQFVFYGSRWGVGDNRETQYVVKGATEGSTLLNASNNDSELATVGGIKPAADGTIDIVVSAGPNNDNGDRFYYINSMMITPDGYSLPGM